MTAPSPAPIDALLGIMRALRKPVQGCPWDAEQTFETIAPYTIEEAYEVADAIARKDFGGLKDELGDLLFQVVFHAQIAADHGHFHFNDVIAAICAKMIRRHPHVFGTQSAQSPGEVRKTWDEIKRQEKGPSPANASAIDGVPAALPALTRALKLQHKAAIVGFDWGDRGPVIAKIAEEAQELSEAAETLSKDDIEDEMGDLLFVCVNLARHLGVDPEAALRRTNAKFTRRFQGVESRLTAEGKSIRETPLAEWDRHWDAIKAEERARKRQSL